jgi:holo-[acyl-carrier protein] synthase
MIQSIGIDIVDIARFQKVVERWGDRFTHRILTEKEIQYCQQKAFALESMAVRFAAKEALIKCLPSKMQIAFPWHDAEILGVNGGKPNVFLSGRLAQMLKDRQIMISLSHSDHSAVAVIILQ